MMQQATEELSVGCVQDQVGQGLEQHGQVDSVPGGWNYMIFKVPCNPNHSMTP